MMRFSNKALRFISVLLALVLLFGSQAFAVNETVGEAAGQTTLPIADEPASDEPSTQAAAEPSAQEPATEEPTTQEPTTGEPTTEPPPEPVPGDINGDGRLTAADARTILRVSARLETCDDAAFALADINRDGKVTAWDARAALRLSAGIPADYVYPTMPQPEPEPEPQPLPAYWFIDAKPICQFPSFPTGCESVATAILLRYHGIQVTPAQFIDNYLDKGRTPYWSNGVCYSPDPQKVFLGNPRSKDGWGVHVGGIERALKKFVDQNRFDIVVPKGYTIDDLCREYIIQNLPVVIWATVKMKDVKSYPMRVIGTNELIYWYSPLHCLTLVGYDATYYYFSDPNTGTFTKFKKDKTQSVYGKIGSQSLVLVPK